MDAINKKYLATVVFNLCELEKEVAERLRFKFSSYDVFDEFDRIFPNFALIVRQICIQLLHLKWVRIKRKIVSLVLID